MKSKIFKTVSLILIAVMICGLFAGCGSSNTNGSTAVALVLGAHANAKPLNLGLDGEQKSGAFSDMLFNTIRNFGYISVISVDANPEVISDGEYALDTAHKSASSQILNKDAKKEAAALQEELRTVKANDAEVDYIKALNLAVRSLSSLTAYDSKKIVVVGSGLSTTGTLSFAENNLWDDPEGIVDKLEEANELPNFEGITVEWYQLGDVAAPQDELSLSHVEKLTNIYKCLIERTGGTFTVNTALPGSGESEAALPTVSLVKLPPVNIDFGNSEEVIKGIKDGIIIGEERVHFKGDKAEYTDKDAAVKALKPLAEILKNNPDIKVVLIGSTAGDEVSEFNTTLSKDRAAAVRKTLIDLGAIADNITAVGMGCADPWHQAGLGTGEKGAVNRKVVVIDASADEAKAALLNGAIAE